MNTHYSEGEWSAIEWKDPKTKIKYLAVINPERVVCLISPVDSLRGEDTENGRLISAAPMMREQLERLSNILVNYPELEHELTIIKDLMYITGYPNSMTEEEVNNL